MRKTEKNNLLTTKAANAERKICSFCNLEKDKEYFYIKVSGSLSSYCKGCASIKRKESKINVAKANGTYRPRAKYKRNIHENLIIDYFSSIDSPEKAYWLGFLYADGYITKTQNTVVLRLGVKDFERLNKFINDVGADLSLVNSYKAYKSCGPSKEICITNKQFVRNLINLGCVNKKSMIIRFPQLPCRGLDLAFLLGFYDGDGTEGANTLTCGSIEFLKDVCLKFSLETSSIKHKSCNIYTLYLGANLFREMLNSFFDSMPRKRKTHKTAKPIVGCATKNVRNKKCIIHKEPVSSKIKNLAYPKQDRQRKKKFEITKEELYNLVWSMSTVDIAKKFEVSDKAIEKRCKSLGISKPHRGYWNKVYAGKNPNE